MHRQPLRFSVPGIGSYVRSVWRTTVSWCIIPMVSSCYGVPAVGRTMNSTASVSSRRHFLRQLGGGFGTLALEALLREELRGCVKRANAIRSASAPRHPIAAFYAASEVGDLSVHGRRAVAGRHVRLQARVAEAAAASRCPRRCARSSREPKFANVTSWLRGQAARQPVFVAAIGESGMWVSELFPHVAKHVDDLCFIHSMQAESNNHAPASYQLHTGDVRARQGEPRLVDDVRPGLGEPGPARLRGAVRRRTARRRGELFQWLFAGGVSADAAARSRARRCSTCCRPTSSPPGSGRRSI